MKSTKIYHEKDINKHYVDDVSDSGIHYPYRDKTNKTMNNKIYKAINTLLEAGYEVTAEKLTTAKCTEEERIPVPEEIEFEEFYGHKLLISPDGKKGLMHSEANDGIYVVLQRTGRNKGKKHLIPTTFNELKPGDWVCVDPNEGHDAFMLVVKEGEYVYWEKNDPLTVSKNQIDDYSIYKVIFE